MEFVADVDVAESTVVQSLFRGLQGLNHACKEGHVRATQLANVLGTHRSTALRLLSTLEQFGLLDQDAISKIYHPNYEQIHNLLPQTYAWIKLAESAMSALCLRTGHAANIGDLEGSNIVYLMSVRPSELESYTICPGSRTPCYATALGKAILAHKLDAVNVDHLLERNMIVPDERFNFDKVELESHLNQIRDSYYAVDDEEYAEGRRCIAAPIFDVNGNVVAAIGINGTVDSITSQLLPELATSVIEAADKISSVLRLAEYSKS